MHFTKVFALVAFFAGAAIAAPHAEPNNKPPKPKPTPKPPVTQKNACNNDAQAYCCTVESGGAYGSCYAYGKTSPITSLRGLVILPLENANVSFSVEQIIPINAPKLLSAATTTREPKTVLVVPWLPIHHTNHTHKRSIQ